MNYDFFLVNYLWLIILILFYVLIYYLRVLKQGDLSIKKKHTIENIKVIDSYPVVITKDKNNKRRLYFVEGLTKHQYLNLTSSYSIEPSCVESTLSKIYLFSESSKTSPVIIRVKIDGIKKGLIWKEIETNEGIKYSISRP